MFRLKSSDIEVKHSSKESNEVAPKIFIGATLQIGDHFCKSNWFVANCRYDVLLVGGGTIMPTHNVPRKCTTQGAMECAMPIASDEIVLGRPRIIASCNLQNFESS